MIDKPPDNADWVATFRDESVKWIGWIFAIGTLAAAIWKRKFVLRFFAKWIGEAIPEDDREFIELRKKGSRELGPKLQAIYDDVNAHWWETVFSKDSAAFQRFANDLYVRLRDLVHDENPRVLLKACWKRLVRLRDKVQAWSGHSQNVSNDAAMKLLFELEQLAKDFPTEADNLA